MSNELPRRTFLSRAALISAAIAAAGPAALGARATGRAAGTPKRGAAGPAPLDHSLLPSAQQTYADNATMVGFGPRITGSTAHNDFIAWLDQEFRAAGCTVLPHDPYPCNLWEAQRWGLEILEGAEAGPVRVASYFPRGGETPESGVEGRLVYLGRAPQPSFSGDVTDVFDIRAMLLRYQRELADWVGAAVAGLGAQTQGAILLIDANVPPPLTVGAIAAATGVYHAQFPGGGWATRPWKKNWLAMGLGGEVGGAAGAVYIVDSSFEALVGNYSPFSGGYEGFPALYVDRDTGATLRRAASATPRVRFTMTAAKTRTTSPSIVAILPGDGTTDEVMIGNTHSDGTNFAEENGTLGLIELARYFYGLKEKGGGLRRSLVFSCVTGHFNGDPRFPQTQGFIASHPDLIDRAAFALTIEHLGCAEWLDDSHGYYPTGLPEPSVLYHDESLTPLMLEIFQRHNLQSHGLARARGSLLFGVGGPLHQVVPAMSYIAGPTYLIQNGPTQGDGVLDKLDPALQARQVAWFADILTRLDGVAPTRLP